MIKTACKYILGLIESLTVASNHSTKQINITFENKNDFNYTSPVVYLIHGQNPKIAMKEGIPTTGGVDAYDFHFTDFTSVTFDINPKIDFTGFKIIPFSSEEDRFCKDLKLSLNGNKIILPSKFSKLTTSTSCHFKIVSLDNINNEVTGNKITLIYNYTLFDWLSDIGNGTDAQKTAKIIRDLSIDPYSTEISLNEAHFDRTLVDISPFMGFIHAEILDLNNKKIEVIPDAIGNLTNLQQLNLNNNFIEVIPDAIGKLTNLKQLLLCSNQIEIIPDAIGKLTNLKTLYLSYNQIEVIPDAIGKLKNLNHLLLPNNFIKVIPPAIGDIPYLEYLVLSNNLIEVIPDAVGKLTHLKSLYLSHNQIEIIPNTIVNLVNLEDLWFDYNNIQSVNKNIYDWLVKKNINLSYNQGFYNNFGN